MKRKINTYFGILHQLHYVVLSSIKDDVNRLHLKVSRKIYQMMISNKTLGDYIDSRIHITKVIGDDNG